MLAKDSGSGYFICCGCKPRFLDTDKVILAVNVLEELSEEVGVWLYAVRSLYEVKRNLGSTRNYLCLNSFQVYADEHLIGLIGGCSSGCS